ncbi:MAG: cell division protein ZapA [Bacillota bacterium]|nr:cell division protein ZapA [Bacillota bacterium]MDW7728729.1 cell division protein ZapA [Bacillota bacterium]
MEDKGKNRVTILIMGEEYILRGTSSTNEMHRVGTYVDRLMRTLAEQNIQMSKHKIAVLTALNLADELLKLKENKRLGSGMEKSGESDNELA